MLFDDVAVCGLLGWVCVWVGVGGCLVGGGLGCCGVLDSLFCLLLVCCVA